MAEVTYYYRTESGGNWTDQGYAVDNILTTYAYTSSDGNFIYLDLTTCDGTDLGTISKVEIRCYGHGDGDDRIDLVFTGGSEYQLTMPGSAEWSAWADVTADPQVGGWTWAKVKDLYFETDYTLSLEFDKSGKGNTMYCAKVEIRVTYDEGGEPPLPNQFNKIFYTEEPPTPSAWNQVKQEAGSGYRKLEYS